MSSGSLIRKIADYFGYSFTKISFQRYGIDPLIDIARISKAQSFNVSNFFDVGANVGQTALEMRKHFPNASIFCFEPVEGTFSQLQSSVAHMKKVNCFKLALSDRNGPANINVFSDSSLVSSLEGNAVFTEGRKEAAVPQSCELLRLDQFCADHNVDYVDVLKIDTEGHDISVLRGASGLLSDGKVRFVLTEFNGLFPIDGTSSGALVTTGEFLAQFGFSLICAYFDDIHFRDRNFVVANALFVRK
jgi:FkbM family methyltransferase